MIDQAQAGRLASVAFDSWQADQLENAVVLYQQALDFADPAHYALGSYHGEFAGVLSTLGRHGDAREQLKLALAAELSQDVDESGSAVVIARYFLAEHYLQHNEPNLVLETIAPSLEAGAQLEWPLRMTKAFALQALGRCEDAKVEADIALRKAPSDEKREELSKAFAEKRIV